MRKLLKSFKTEINPSTEQKIIINKTVGACRFVYNLYLAHNKKSYESDKGFVSGKSFSVWLNNDYIPNNPDKFWLKEVYSKSIKKSIENGDNAFRRFFKEESDFPKFKKKGKSDPSMYFVKNNPTDLKCERHRIKIPKLGWVKLKEKGYLPTTKDGYQIRSGTISKRADRYYVSVMIDVPSSQTQNSNNDGIGIDLGLKNFATISNGNVYENINKSQRIIKLEKQLKRSQRSLSHKFHNLKKEKKGEATYRNIQKQKLKVQKIYQKLDNIRTDYINKTIAKIVKTKPSYIAIEDLNVSGMMKNKHLSKSIASQKFYEFKTKLISKCHEQGIEVRVVDRWYPSSKMCHHCKTIKKDLKLKDRIFKCSCGYIKDRDYNASLNLKDADAYVLA